jgi:hypothetical protein
MTPFLGFLQASLVEEVVEEGEEKMDARFGAEEALEDKAGPGVGKDRAHRRAR